MSAKLVALLEESHGHRVAVPGTQERPRLADDVIRRDQPLITVSLEEGQGVGVSSVPPSR
jgi:hypothetical protein